MLDRQIGTSLIDPIREIVFTFDKSACTTFGVDYGFMNMHSRNNYDHKHNGCMSDFISGEQQEAKVV